jgi:hypothetical protein
VSELLGLQGRQDSSLERVVLLLADVLPAFAEWVFSKDLLFCHLCDLLWNICFLNADLRR